MNGFLVDTSVISEVLRPIPDILTIMPAGARRSHLAQSIETLIRDWFGDRTLPMTQKIAAHWGLLEGQRQARRPAFPCS